MQNAHLVRSAPASSAEEVSRGSTALRRPRFGGTRILQKLCFQPTQPFRHTCVCIGYTNKYMCAQYACIHLCVYIYIYTYLYLYLYINIYIRIYDLCTYKHFHGPSKGLEIGACIFQQHTLSPSRQHGEVSNCHTLDPTFPNDWKNRGLRVKSNKTARCSRTQPGRIQGSGFRSRMASGHHGGSLCPEKEGDPNQQYHSDSVQDRVPCSLLEGYYLQRDSRPVLS